MLLVFLFPFFFDWIWRMEKFPFTIAHCIRIVEFIIVNSLDESFWPFDSCPSQFNNARTPLTLAHEAIAQARICAKDRQPAFRIGSPCRATTYVTLTRGGASPCIAKQVGDAVAPKGPSSSARASSNRVWNLDVASCIIDLP